MSKVNTSVEMTKEKTTKNMVRYSSGNPALPTVYVGKSILPNSTPEKITVTVSFEE